MTRSLTRLQALLLAFTLLLGVASITFGLFAVGSQQWLWSETFHVRVGFRQIRGAEIGTRVRVLGKDAGEIEGILLPDSPTGEVTLVLRLDKAVQGLIRLDASVQIVAEGMVGGKVVEIDPGSESQEAALDQATLRSIPSTEISEMLAKVNDTLQGIHDGHGSLGKFVKDDEFYKEALQVLQQSRGLVASLKQNSDAIKGMPLVRSYVSDVVKELVRPDCERSRMIFREGTLFEAGHAVLTAAGREELDALVPWFEGLKQKNSKVVIVGYAHPRLDPELARRLTKLQSEAVGEYLTSHHAVQKLGWFSRREVVSIGCGVDPPPVPEKEKLPLPRIEVVVFVPQS